MKQYGVEIDGSSKTTEFYTVRPVYAFNPKVQKVAHVTLINGLKHNVRHKTTTLSLDHNREDSVSMHFEGVH